jgi:hypothetical protein
VLSKKYGVPSVVVSVLLEKMGDDVGSDACAVGTYGMTRSEELVWRIQKHKLLLKTVAEQEDLVMQAKKDAQKEVGVLVSQ